MPSELLNSLVISNMESTFTEKTWATVTLMNLQDENVKQNNFTDIKC